jgi:protein-tyrosine phosphatase
MYGGDLISHIINIYEKEESPPAEKGNLFLSGVYVLDSPDIIKKSNIKSVISILNDYTYEAFRVKSKINKIGVENHEWYELEDSDDQNIFPFLGKAHEFIKEKLVDHNVLVHCQMGMSRSSSLVIAFLMKEYGMKYKEAKAFAKKRRPIV